MNPDSAFYTSYCSKMQNSKTPDNLKPSSVVRNTRYDSKSDEDSEEPDVPSEDPVNFDSARILTERDEKETVFISHYQTNPNRFKFNKSNDKSLFTL